MGCWNGTDMITHLPIMAGEKIRVLVLKQCATEPGCGGVTYAHDLWAPLGPAIKGEYNDYGCPENIEDDVAAKWLNHILPMNDEIRKGIDGHFYEGDDLDEKILAVERGESCLPNGRFARVDGERKQVPVSGWFERRRGSTCRVSVLSIGASLWRSAWMTS